MTFDEWWKEFSLTIWEAGGLASPNQVRALFKNCYLEGYEKGVEDLKIDIHNTSPPSIGSLI